MIQYLVVTLVSNNTQNVKTKQKYFKEKYKISLK